MGFLLDALDDRMQILAVPDTAYLKKNCPFRASKSLLSGFNFSHVQGASPYRVRNLFAGFT